MSGQKQVRLPIRLRRGSKTGYKGVVQSRPNRWYAQLSKQNRKFNLGTFDSPHEAALAVNLGQEILFPGLPESYRNVIPQECLPDPERTAQVLQEVRCRLARYEQTINSTAHLDLDFLIFVSSPPERRCSEGSQG